MQRLVTQSMFRWNMCYRTAHLHAGRTVNIPRRYMSHSSSNTSSFFDNWTKYKFPTALGFVAISLVVLRRKQLVEVELDDGTVEKIYKRVRWQNLKDLFLLNAVPYNTVSLLWGKINNVEIPFTTLRVSLFKFWTKVFSCDLDEAEKDLKDYKNLQQFFTRNLKKGCREIATSENAIVSPTDSQIYSFGSLNLNDNGSNDHWFSAKVEQIKGRTYEIEKLLGNFRRYLDKGSKLNYVVFYLSPGDYHHYHSPYDITVSELRHYPGKLFPVKESFLEKIDNLYGLNERVSLLGKWKHGFFGYVAVGACNVGSMTIDFEPNLSTNKKTNKQPKQIEYEERIAIKKGQHVGTFNLGSTVVLIFESPKNFEFCIKPKQIVKIGQPIGFITSKDETSDLLMKAPPWPTN